MGVIEAWAHLGPEALRMMAETNARVHVSPTTIAEIGLRSSEFN